MTSSKRWSNRNREKVALLSLFDPREPRLNALPAGRFAPMQGIPWNRDEFKAYKSD
jgi:hypothetical protein